MFEDIQVDKGHYILAIFAILVTAAFVTFLVLWIKCNQSTGDCSRCPTCPSLQRPGFDYRGSPNPRALVFAAS